MAEGPGSLMNIGDLAKPVDTFIKKVSEGMGGYFRPWQIERVAKAESAAELIKAQGKIDVEDLQQRTARRFIEEQARHQINMEAIAGKAIPLLNAASDSAKISDDWVTNFFDKCRIISDDEMQALWAKVLAGEANAPGTFSRRTVNFLADVDKMDAEAFARLCRFCWTVEKDQWPIVFDIDKDIYKKEGVTLHTLAHLNNIGLCQVQHAMKYSMPISRVIAVSYFDSKFEVRSAGPALMGELNMGAVMLSRVGEELAKVCEVSPVVGLVDYVMSKWKGNSVKIDAI